MSTVLLLNSICNENCLYCDSNLSNKNTDIDKIKNLTIENTNTVIFCGGEPGLIKKSSLLLLLNKLKNFNIKNIKVATNGTYIEKYYNIDSYYKFEYIHHIISSKHKIYSNLNNVINLLVINDDNIDDCETIIKNNSSLLFYIRTDWYINFSNIFLEKFKNILQYNNVFYSSEICDIDKNVIYNNINILKYLNKINKVRCDGHIYKKLY